jgi:hypothetical protein
VSRDHDELLPPPKRPPAADEDPDYGPESGDYVPNPPGEPDLRPPAPDVEGSPPA